MSEGVSSSCGKANETHKACVVGRKTGDPQTLPGTCERKVAEDLFCDKNTLPEPVAAPVEALPKGAS
jgi:hypothetical protein